MHQITSCGASLFIKILLSLLPQLLHINAHYKLRISLTLSEVRFISYFLEGGMTKKEATILERCRCFPSFV